MTSTLRRPAELTFAEELEALKAVDDSPKPQAGHYRRKL